MSRLSSILRMTTSGPAFYCPACDGAHIAFTKMNDRSPGWTWNGSVDKPTFTPSLRLSGGVTPECHCNVTDGRIIYHADSKHAMAGQTVDVPPWPEGYGDGDPD